MSIEREYSTVDFSRFSQVKESLREKLHAARHQLRSDSRKNKLSMDELDYVAAAGAGLPADCKNPLKPDQF